MTGILPSASRSVKVCDLATVIVNSVCFLFACLMLENVSGALVRAIVHD